MSEPIRWELNDQLYVIDGHTWATDHDCEPVWLGLASIIIPLARGEAEMPEEGLTRRQRRIIMELRKENSIGEIGASPGGPGIRRGRRVQPTARQ